MINATRKAAIAAYRNRKDSFDWNGLMDYADALLTARDKIEEGVTPVSLNEEIADKAIKEKVTYLSLCPVEIKPETFRGNLKLLIKEFLEQNIIHDEHNKSLLRDLDLSALTDATIALAGQDPNRFFISAVEELGGNNEDELFSIVLAGLLINALRPYLDNLGQEMTEYLSTPSDLKVSDSPKTCPTCGQPPSLAAMGKESNTMGHSRKLFCACCGTIWPFERVRCAFCGTRNTNKLKYVHSDADPVHRLYVCSNCEGVLPTVFQENLTEDIDFDVEQTASGVIQSVYQQEVELDYTNQEKKH